MGLLRRALPLAVGLLVPLFAAACGSTPASSAPHPKSTASAHSSKGNTCALTVDITTTSGTTWGTVDVRYGSTSKTASGASQTYTVPCGSSVSLTQSATSQATWPFSDWTISGDGSAAPSSPATGNSLTLTVSAPTTVTAVYVLPSSSSGGGSTAASSGSGSGSSSGSGSGSSSGGGW